MTTITPQTLVDRWCNPESRPTFKGALIDSHGCCCAQGDCLRLAGWTDDQIRYVEQDRADFEVAAIIGISVGEAILLRIANDNTDGCPQDVFRDRAKLLGPHHRLWTAFMRHIDSLDVDGWRKVIYAWDAARAYAWSPAGQAMWTTGRAAARAAAEAVAGTAARAPAGEAARELLFWAQIGAPCFLQFFFEDPAAWVAQVAAGGPLPNGGEP